MRGYSSRDQDVGAVEEPGVPTVCENPRHTAGVNYQVVGRGAGLIQGGGALEEHWSHSQHCLFKRAQSVVVVLR